MAQKLKVLLTCDLDDGTVEATDTVTFCYDGQTYAFELCKAHLEQFRSVMDGWVAAARRTEDGARPSLASAGALASDSGAIRDWARSEGYEVSERGRIATEVRAAYDAAHRS